MRLEDIKKELKIVFNEVDLAHFEAPRFGFEVHVDHNGSSLNAVRSIWTGQHQCVIEGFSPEDRCPSDPDDVIIKHQLSSSRGHFSVLDQAFVVMAVKGAPHESVAQLTRHHQMKYLVQSGRYTGQRFIKVAKGELSIEECFYHDPVGEYQDRLGNKFEVTEADIQRYYKHCLLSCQKYFDLISMGYSYETARSYIPYGFRQNFQMAGTLRAWWHMLDQRTKADVQLSTRVLAIMFHEALKQDVGELQQWYGDNRLGKARLAP